MKARETLIKKLIQQTHQLERLIAGGKIRAIDGVIEMRKVLERELEKMNDS